MNCTIELSSGPIEYQDQGSGPTVVLLHGLLMDWTLWSGVTGELSLVLSGRLPPALFGMFMHQLRMRPVRRLPIAFGWLTKRGDAVTRHWLEPILTSAEIRRDTVRVLRSIAAARRLLEQAAGRLPSFDRPVLVVWAAEDRVMPRERGARLSELLSDARLIEIADSYTLIPLDQPERLAHALREFTRELRPIAPPLPSRSAER